MVEIKKIGSLYFSKRLLLRKFANVTCFSELIHALLQKYLTSSSEYLLNLMEKR